MTQKAPHATKPKGDSAQIRAFRKAAREAGADDNEERFKDALRTITKAKPVRAKRQGRGESGRDDF